MQHIEFRAMGSHILAALDTDDASAQDALARVPRWFAEWEAALSRFRDDSELNALNRAQAQWVGVSETLWQALDAAIQAARISGDLVTPAVLDAIQAAGYDRTFEALATSPAASNASAAQSLAVVGIEPLRDWRAIERDAKRRAVRLPEGMRLDLGGTGKGWAADQAAHRLSSFAPAMVDAGGDIAISEELTNGDAWPIAVADPLHPELDLELLMIERGGVATSGRDYRRWQRDGKWLHHIIDPRTGAPAETDVLSATVIAPTTRAAELAAKVALILGSAKGLEWIEARSELAGLVVLEDGQVLKSSRLDEYVWHEPITWFEAPNQFGGSAG